MTDVSSNNEPRVALITGAASGIGLACAERFRAEGWQVIGLDRSEGRFVTHRCDLTQQQEIETIAAEIQNNNAEIHALVHAAARMTPHRISEVDPQELETTFRVNVVALYTLIGVLKGALTNAKGAVVALSSVHAGHTSVGALAYATSKAALEGFVRASALELAPDVRVNAIAPGAIDTPMLEAGLRRNLSEGESADSRRVQLMQATPQKKIGEAHEIADFVLYLSTTPSFMTGQVVTIDGGVSIKLASET